MQRLFDGHVGELFEESAKFGQIIIYDIKIKTKPKCLTIRAGKECRVK